LERDTSAVVSANGGKIVGGVKHPINTSDFSSFLLQAQASKAKVIGLANAGGDTTKRDQQAAEFGIVAGGQKLAALLLFVNGRAFAGPEDRAGPVVHGILLLGHERAEPRLVQALHGAVAKRHDALDDRGGKLRPVLHYLKSHGSAWRQPA